MYLFYCKATLIIKRMSMSNILNYDGVCETRHNTHGQEKKACLQLESNLYPT